MAPVMTKTLSNTSPVLSHSLSVNPWTIAGIILSFLVGLLVLALMERKKMRDARERFIAAEEAHQNQIWTSETVENMAQLYLDNPQHKIFAGLTSWQQRQTVETEKSPHADTVELEGKHPLEPSPSADLSFKCQGLETLEAQDNVIFQAYVPKAKESLEIETILEETTPIPSFAAFVQDLEAEEEVELLSFVNEELELPTEIKELQVSKRLYTIVPADMVEIEHSVVVDIELSSVATEEEVYEEDDSFGCIDAKRSSSSPLPPTRPAVAVFQLAPLLQQYIEADCTGRWAQRQLPSGARGEWIRPGKSPLRQSTTVPVLVPAPNLKISKNPLKTNNDKLLKKTSSIKTARPARSGKENRVLVQRAGWF